MSTSPRPVSYTHLHLGGYILFRENFEEKTPVQAAEMVRACQAAAALPMLVGVDEEGGTVTVSYTHLDVYKRQAMSLIVNSCIPLF